MNKILNKIRAWLLNRAIKKANRLHNLTAFKYVVIPAGSFEFRVMKKKDAKSICRLKGLSYAAIKQFFI
jgi:hypothetical protein